MVNLEHAKIDPASEFHRPHDIVEDKSLSRAEKIDILRRWAYDEREIEVAVEENMAAATDRRNGILDEILKSLLELGITQDEKEFPPTKQG